VSEASDEKTRHPIIRGRCKAVLIFTTNKKRLLKHFQKDPVLFAYHIGDLDDFFFADCLWPSVVNERSGLDDVLLTYTGGDTPAVLAFGRSDRFPELLRDYLPLAPRRFFCHFQKSYRDLFHEFCKETPLGTHLKMTLDTDALAELPGSGPLRSRQSHTDTPIVRLDSTHEPLLRKLYAAAYPDNYFVPRMLQTGKYFGWVEGDAIVAVAGVHVVSDDQRIAVLGNVTTHPEARGRGLATQLTRVLAAELVVEGKIVCLNVKVDNAPAIACYRKIGFVPVHEYEEALFELR
jgi:ribosomal protein S18 acetylase RimI-like enzyme